MGAAALVADVNSRDLVTNCMDPSRYYVMVAAVVAARNRIELALGPAAAAAAGDVPCAVAFAFGDFVEHGGFDGE